MEKRMLVSYWKQSLGSVLAAECLMVAVALSSSLNAIYLMPRTVIILVGEIKVGA